MEYGRWHLARIGKVLQMSEIRYVPRHRAHAAPIRPSSGNAKAFRETRQTTASNGHFADVIHVKSKVRSCLPRQDSNL